MKKIRVSFRVNDLIDNCVIDKDKDLPWEVFEKRMERVRRKLL